MSSSAVETIPSSCCIGSGLTGDDERFNDDILLVAESVELDDSVACEFSSSLSIASSLELS